MQDARANLRALVGLLREFDMQEQGSHMLCADVVELYAATQVWFIAEPGYKVRSAGLLADAPIWHELLHAIKCTCNRLEMPRCVLLLVCLWVNHWSGFLRCLLATECVPADTPWGCACLLSCLHGVQDDDAPKMLASVQAHGAGVLLPAPVFASARLCS